MSKKNNLYKGNKGILKETNPPVVFPGSGRRAQGATGHSSTGTAPVSTPTMAQGATGHSSAGTPPVPSTSSHHHRHPPTTATGATPRRPSEATVLPPQDGGSSHHPPPNQPRADNHPTPQARQPEASARVDEGGPEEEEEADRDRVIITGEGGLYLEEPDLNQALEASMAKIEDDLDYGDAGAAFEEWKRTRGRLVVTPADSDTPDGLTARESGDRLINLVNGPPPTQITLTNGDINTLRARWSSQLPVVAQMSVRYQGRPRDPRGLIESPSRGIGRLNGLSEAASREIRFISHNEVVDQERGSRDTLLRFEVGVRSAEELLQVLGRRGGQIRVGASSSRIQHNRRTLGPDSAIAYHYPS